MFVAKKITPPAGLEPAIFRLEVERAIHYAIGVVPSLGFEPRKLSQQNLSLLPLTTRERWQQKQQLTWYTVEKGKGLVTNTVFTYIETYFYFTKIITHPNYLNQCQSQIHTTQNQGFGTQ